jgi:serine/threonine-protein kinase HipA
MSAPLQVYWDQNSDPVGELFDEGAPRFRYHPGALQISHSLPLDGGDSYPITFFDNLLPDGVQRERLARRLGVADTSTMSMLAAIGGDCAGALSITPDTPIVVARPPQPLDEPLLRKMLTMGVVPTTVNEGLRLSLAGAQDKLAVVLWDDNTLWMPSGTAPSTHIPNRDYRGICDNEHFILELARAVGLSVARSQLWPMVVDGTRFTALLVKRFDRLQGVRLHQEDMLQALGHPPSHKYQADGGPSLVEVVALLDDASTEPADILGLVRWQAFNIAVGNNDGHAKNMALLRSPQVRLAPSYDLVCTRVWPNLDARLAFNVDTVRDGGNAGPHAWSRFAGACGLTASTIVGAVAEIAHAVDDAAAKVAEAVMDAGADRRAVRHALEHVQAHAKRMLRLHDLEKV